MNRKMLGFTVVLMAVAMLVSSLIGVVIASPYSSISVEEAKKNGHR